MSGSHAVGDGPDWQDVLISLALMEKHHQVACSIIVLPDAKRRAHLEVAVCATPDPTEPRVSDATDGRLWAVRGSLPTEGRASFASRVWAMCINLDTLLAGERWRQMTLDDDVGA